MRDMCVHVVLHPHLILSQTFCDTVTVVGDKCNVL